MGVVQEVLSSVRLVKAFGHEDREQKRFLDQSDKRLQRELKVAVLQGGFDVLDRARDRRRAPPRRC